MNEFEIRKAQSSDIISINEITNFAITNSNYNLNTTSRTINDTISWFNSHQNNNYPVIVAVLNNYIVGWASLSRFRPFNGYNLTAEISIYVRNNYYRQGIGEKLLFILELEAKQRNFHSLVAVITSNNIPSICLHKKFGYSIKGRMEELAYKNNEFLDVVFMTKLLNK